MKIPQGYKQTELGIIPEDWQVEKLVSIGFTYAGLTGKKKDDFNCGSAKYIPFLNILNNPRIDIYDLEYVNVRPNEIQNVVQDGDLFFNTSSETPEEVGMCSVLTEKIENTYLNSFCFGYRLYNNDKVAGVFLSYYFRSTIGRTLMSVLAQGATRYNLAKSTFLESKIALPPIREQRRIAEALSDVDALIAALDKKIAKKRLIKQGTMQQLLTGKKRLQGFTNEWVDIEFGHYVDVYRGGSPRPIEQFLTSNTDGVNWIKIGDVLPEDKYINSTTEKIIKKGVQFSREVFAGDFILSNSMSFGRPYILNINGCIHDGWLVIQNYNSTFDIDFLYYILCSDNVMKQYIAMAAGSSVKNLNKEKVAALQLYIPANIEEQHAIAMILSEMDKEIADLEGRRDKYKLIKSGMMQKLLTGQIRLVKPLAPVVPLEFPDAKVREIPLQTHVIAGHIVNMLYQASGCGRTKLQKTLHLVGYHCQLDFGNEYIRNTAGPDDQAMMNHIDGKFKQYRHVKIEAKKENGKTRYNYVPTAMIDELEQVYETYPQAIRSAVDSLINKIKTMDLARAEIVSTLYAVWNNRIIKGEPISDDLLLDDFYAWSKHKSDFSRDLVLWGLNYMRREGIIPIGWGKYIDKK